jgi:hypothetical protein
MLVPRTHIVRDKSLSLFARSAPETAVASGGIKDRSIPEISRYIPEITNGTLPKRTNWFCQNNEYVAPERIYIDLNQQFSLGSE